MVKYPSGKSMTRYTLPNGVLSIKSGAFSYCVNLTSITVQDDLEIIEERAFSESLNLTSILVPPSNSHFQDLNGALFSKDLSSFVYLPAQHPEASFVVPPGTVSIASFAFERDSNLQTLSLPDTLTDVGNLVGALAGHSLTSISVTSGNDHFESLDGVLFTKNKTKLICYPFGKIRSSLRCSRRCRDHRILRFLLSPTHHLHLHSRKFIGH